MDNWKITEKNKKVPQPDKIKIPLLDHQMSMLYKCLQIEKNNYNSENAYGVIADKAGSGKTAVIISLIVADKILHNKTQNLIVVPQNIHQQWLEEFKKFTEEGFLNVKSFVSYADITELYSRSKEDYKKYDVMITVDLYYNLISEILNQTGINIKRIIFDEIDSVYDLLHRIEQKRKDLINTRKRNKEQGLQNTLISSYEDLGSKNYFTWFISASFNNCITSKGFIFNDTVIPLDKLHELMVQCEDNYLENSNFKLETPVEKKIECDDITDIFFNCLSIVQLEHFNSFSYRRIINKETKKKSDNAEEAMINIVENIYHSYIISKQNIEDYTKKNITIESLKQDLKRLHKDYTGEWLTQQINTISFYEKEKQFNKKLLEEFYKCTSNTETNKISLETMKKHIINYINNISINNNTKLKHLEKIFENFKNKKMIIFSDSEGSFYEVSKLLDKFSIKYSDLKGGTSEAISKIITSYKNNEIDVLLIESSSEGCGMNLENTTDILFLHKTGEVLYNQMLGRALRPGRNSKLSVTTLINKNEIV